MAMCVDPTSYKEAEKIRFRAVSDAADLRQTAIIAQLILDGSQAYDSYRSLNDISKRAVGVEEAQYGQIKNVYWPAEDQFLEEHRNGQPWESQAVLAKRYAGRIWAPIAAKFAGKLHELECTRPRYCASAYMRAYQELQVAKAATKANVLTMADKMAFYEVEAVSDSNFDRRKTAVGLFLGLVGEAQSLMGAAANGYASIAMDSFNAVGSGLGALLANRESRTQSGDAFHARTAAGAQRFSSASPSPYQMEGGGSLRMSSELSETEAGFSGVGTVTPRSSAGQAMTMLGGASNTPEATESNLARGGKVSVTIPGHQQYISSSGGLVNVPSRNFVIDLDKTELVDVSRYKAGKTQTGPNVLPGSPDGMVSYQSP